ncbi:MAG: type II toxin-antitoxin system RelB/DinJ family antitoxin [Hyphomicrobiales bacterium]
MGKTATITARIEPELKRKAEGVLDKLGVNTTDAITMFLNQVVLRRGLPFEVRIPNAATRRALAELEAGGGERFTGGAGAAFRRILGKRKKPARAG